MGILNKWFGKKQEVKAIAGLQHLTSTQQLIFLNMKSGDGVDVYKKLWVAYKCISIIGENVSTIPVSIVDSKGEVVDFGRIGKDVQSLINNPNQIDSGIDIVDQYTQYFLMTGDGYIFRVDGINPDYWTLQSQNIEALKGDPAKGEPIIKGYRDTSNKSSRVYPAEDVIHMKSFNPTSRINGMSRLSAGMSEIKFAELQSDYKNNLYNNQAVIPGALSTDGSLTDEQFKRLSEEFQKNHGGTANAGRNLLLEAGLKYTPMAFSPTDLDIIRSESMTEGKIASLLGVPPEMLNLTDQKNYANYREARLGFYIETVIPLRDKINAKFNQYFYPDGSMKFKINKNEVEALRMSAEEIDKMWWLSPNNKRMLGGAEPLDDPLMDEIYMPAGMVPISMLGGLDNTTL